MQEEMEGERGRGERNMVGKGEGRRKRKDVIGDGRRGEQLSNCVRQDEREEEK